MTTINDFARAAALRAPLYPVSVSDDGNGGILDMQDTDGPCFAIQTVGEIATGEYAGRFQESDDGSDWSEIAGAEFASVETGDDLQAVSFRRTQRYLRYLFTFTGSSILVGVVLGTQRKVV